MSRITVSFALGVALLIGADALDGDKFLEKADERFEQGLERAQESYQKAARDAYETRLKTYRSILAAATKAGDFDRATAVKTRILEIEAEQAQIGDRPSGRSTKRPKERLLSHTCYFSLRDNSDTARQKLIDACRKYLKDHPGTVSFAVGTRDFDLSRDINDKDFDVSLQIVFKDRKSHDAYHTAERHKQFVEECRDNLKKVRVFDSDVVP